jgi:hypothetical protein
MWSQPKDTDSSSNDTFSATPTPTFTQFTGNTNPILLRAGGSRSPSAELGTTSELVDVAIRSTTQLAHTSARRHKAVKEHFCAQCSAGFTRRSSLNKHIANKHSAMPQMKYCPHAACSFMTRNASALASHKKCVNIQFHFSTFHNYRAAHASVYFCRACQQRFSDRRTLLQHLSKRHMSDASLFGRASETPDPDTRRFAMKIGSDH